MSLNLPLSCRATRVVLDAELAAVAWAAGHAAEMNWNNIQWSLDAATVVKEINSREDHNGWSSRYTLLQVRSLFDRHNWLISWNARSSNAFADALATSAIFLLLLLFPSLQNLWLLLRWTSRELFCNSPLF